MSLDNKVELLNIEIKELRGIIAETEKAFANFQEEVNARFRAAQEQTADNITFHLRENGVATFSVG